MNIEQARRTQIFTPLYIVRDMIRIVPDISGTILDLCAGEGVFTSVLIEEFKVDPSRITLIEIDPILCNKLRKKFPLCNVIEGDLFEATKDCAGKFDVVFSNPPYQVQSWAQKRNNGDGRSPHAKPIYHEIVVHALDNLQPKYVSMITPSRWMAGGMGLGKYRDRMLADTRIRLIQDFPGLSEVFKTVSISGGVSYFLWDKEYKGECEFNGYKRPLDEFDIVVRDNAAISILKKVLDKHPVGQFCDKKVLPRKPFGLPTNFKDWVPGGIEGTVKCITRGRKEKFVSQGKYNDRFGVLNKWKVFSTAGYNSAYEFKEGNPLYVLNSFMSDQRAICTETYLVIGSFDTKKEAKHYLYYANTKFYRFMVSLRKITQHVSTSKFTWVPDFQDYSKAWTDEELYQHFGLTKKEIDHIESTIKERKGTQRKQ